MEKLLDTYCYVFPGRFCSQSAMSTRVMSFCKVLKAMGHNVIVITLDDVKPYQLHEHHQVQYISIANLSKSLCSKILNYLLFKRRLSWVLKIICKKTNIKGILFYDASPNVLIFLKKYTRRKKIKLFHDSVEWYSIEQFKKNKLLLIYFLRNILNSYLIDKHIFVFAISKYLTNYFKNKGISVTRVPIMFDLDEIVSDKELVHDKLVLIYAGCPGKKDYLREIVEGLASLDIINLEKIQLHIFGANEKQLIDLCEVSIDAINKCRDSLIIHGWVNRGIVLEYMRQAHFTVLLRSEELRYAKAGFPTKVVESLATGTPVICNITSDLGDYLRHRENALLVDGCSAEALKKVLEQALMFSPEEKKALCVNSRMCAENYFDYRSYITQFKSFME